MYVCFVCLFIHSLSFIRIPFDRINFHKLWSERLFSLFPLRHRRLSSTAKKSRKLFIHSFAWAYFSTLIELAYFTYFLCSRRTSKYLHHLKFQFSAQLNAIRTKYVDVFRFWFWWLMLLAWRWLISANDVHSYTQQKFPTLN